MPNIVLVGFNPRGQFNQRITEIAEELGELQNTVITELSLATVIKVGTTENSPYAEVRCDDLDNAHRFAKRLSQIGLDVEVIHLRGYYPATPLTSS